MSFFKINKFTSNLPFVKPHFFYRFIWFTCLLTSFACDNSDKIKPTIEKKPVEPNPNPNPKPNPNPDSILVDSVFNQPTISKPNIPFYFESIYKEPTDNPNTLEGVALGKLLFFDKSLSSDNTISCSTCHRPEKGFTDGIPLAVGIGSKIGKRNTPGLFNVGIQKKFFWDGRVNSLEEQSLHPIQDPNEMNMQLDQLITKLNSKKEYANLFGRAFGSKGISIDRVAKALAQFQRSLTSHNSKYDRYLKGQYIMTLEEQKGMTLFFQHPTAGSVRGGNCGDCHLPKTLSGKLDDFDGFHNTGLTELNSNDIGLQAITGKSADFGKFKTPDLRNIALTAPYMHDGRFQTLEQVLDHYNSETLFSKPNVDILIPAGRNEISFDPIAEQSLKLTPAEKNSIITFLHTLTDSSALHFKP